MTTLFENEVFIGNMTAGEMIKRLGNLRLKYALMLSTATAIVDLYVDSEKLDKKIDKTGQEYFGNAFWV